MPNHTSLYANTGFISLLIPAVRTADANSTGLDLQDCDDAVLLFDVGNSADTLSGSVYIELEVEESDDNTNWTDVANADLTNYVTGTNPGTVAVIDAPAEDSNVFAVGYKGSKRYIRGVFNVTGTHSTGTPVGVLGLRGRNRQAPVNAYT
ncbi:hypothetical protein [Tautonia plasticadhaerens]|uniref:Uncharacterized protein n=1 Tax=Tautonia plasticadhaerens TaxID=2527974 RepID=A0A518H251_9BACT|nr:hypothetical protein [Tautonia plasticadhaerens]QDV34916.1 hypothetical protein ElP_28130 [Tautonia plasticadhaerens]